MSYRVNCAGRALVVPSTTPAVGWVQPLSAQAGNFKLAVRSGSTFDFKDDASGRTRASLTLTVGTLADFPVGASVLVEDGARYLVGTVESDGASALAPDGSALAPTTRAVLVSTTNAQRVPTTGMTMRLLGTAQNGAVWFVDTRSGQQVGCGPMSTVQSLAGQGPAIVEAGGWMVVVL